MTGNINDQHIRTSKLLQQLTLEEKVSLMSGKDFWRLAAIERLGIPSLTMSDGPTGLRSENSEPSVVFPVGSALAATWDPELIFEIGAAMGREAIAHGVDVLLAPGVNIQRTPLGGRNFEYYSEDPYLAGAIGTGFVRGVQSEGVGTSVKHFAANNQEFMRMSGSSDVTERTLREIYLPAFETIVREAQPWTIMSAYNRLNGVFASENDWLLNTVLKEEWGFDGVVVSDWGANKSTAGAANGGLDLEMPGPGRDYGQKLIDAVEAGEVQLSTIDDHASRILRLIERCGLLDDNPKQVRGELRSDAHRTLARKAAAQSMVLLRNENAALPLSGVRKLAVIGAAADYPAIQGGGSSQVSPDRIVTPLQALRMEMEESVEILFARGIDHEPSPPVIDGSLLRTEGENGEQGLVVRYFDNADFAGSPVSKGIDWRFAKLGFGREAQNDDDPSFSVEWSGWIVPRHSGEHQLRISHSNPSVQLEIADQVLVDDSTERETELLFMILSLNRRNASIVLEAGKAYPITIRYSQPAQGAIRGFNIFTVGMREPAPVFEDAITAAREADAAIVFVGSGTTSETEGRDRSSMALPRLQNQLVRDVARINSRTIVVVNSGAPVEMPWIDDVSAVIQMWLPGQEGGGAVADILSGKINPSGKLPMSFPRRYEDNPSYLHYPGGSHVEYGEGLFVGYRHYDAMGIEPLFPFGFGMSYTSFAVKPGTCGKEYLIGDPLHCSVVVENSGDCQGTETVQLYIEDCTTQETTPLRCLRNFKKATLAAGESTILEFRLGPRDFSHYCIDEARWTVTPGLYRIHIGPSSRDLPVVYEVTVGTD